MDLVLAYKKLVIESKHTIVQKCILGHAKREEKAPIERDNTTTVGLANKRLRQQKSRSVDMMLHWIRDRV